MDIRENVKSAAAEGSPVAECEYNMATTVDKESVRSRKRRKSDASLSG